MQAPIVNNGGDSFLKMDVFPISRARDPDLQSRVILHTVVRHSLTSTYPGTCQISLSWS